MVSVYKHVVGYCSRLAPHELQALYCIPIICSPIIHVCGYFVQKRYIPPTLQVLQHITTVRTSKRT